MKRLFTLIELVVVIVVLGVLATIVLPNTASVKEETKETAMSADGRNVQMAVDMYQLSNFGAYPVRGDEQPTLGDPKDVDFALLHPIHLRDMPQHDEVYYQIDHSGVVYHGKVDGPRDFTQGEDGLRWTPDEGASGYDVYEVVDGTTGSLKDVVMKRVDQTKGDVGESVPDGYATTKRYLISAKDEHGFESAPVKEGYVGSTAYSRNDFIEAPMPPEEKRAATFMRTYGGSMSDIFHSVEETDDGGYVAVGISQSSNGDLTWNKGNTDFVIAKFDENGEKVWMKTYGGSDSDILRSVRQTDDGGYVAVGYSASVNGDLTNTKGVVDAVIAKFDRNGNKVWMKAYGGSSSDYLHGVQLTDDGGYIAVGYTQSTNGDWVASKGGVDAVIAKFDQNGNKVWGKIHGGNSHDYFSAVKSTEEGGYVAVGYSYSTDGDLTNSKGGINAIIAKFDQNGNKSWMKVYGGSSHDYFNEVQQSDDGGYIAVGYSQSSDGDMTQNKGVIDTLIAKFDRNGNKVWMKSYGGSQNEIFLSVDRATDGGYVAVGYSASVNGDFISENGGNDAIITKFDENGGIVWTKNHGGSGSEVLQSVYATKDGGYATVGYSNSKDGDLMENKGSNDFVIAKFDQYGEWK